jgi:hypothetical protein
MRFLQSFVLPLLVAGTLAKTQLQARDVETTDNTDIAASVGNAASTENVENVDSSDSIDVSGDAGDADDVDAGGVSPELASCFQHH